MRAQLSGRVSRYHARSLPERMAEARAGMTNLGRRAAETGGMWGEPVGYALGWSQDLVLFILQLALWCLIWLISRGRPPWRPRFPRFCRRIGGGLGHGVGVVGGSVLGAVAGCLWGGLSGRAPNPPSPYRGWLGS
jgi:hypothetical protein